MRDPPAADRELFFKPLFLTEALRPPKNPQKTGELSYLVYSNLRWCCNIQQTLPVLWVCTLWCRSVTCWWSCIHRLVG